MSTVRQLCTFCLDDLFLGIDVLRIQEIQTPLETTRVPLAPKAVLGLVNLRGQVVTALDLRERFALPPRAEGASPMSVVLRSTDDAIALLVDEVGDIVEVTEEMFERTPETVKAPLADLIAGVYKLNDRLLLALDVERAVAIGGEREESAP
jgi:purine-binding chemotaxis protein CheW